MYRLAEMSDSRRKSIGAALLVLGLIGLAIAVLWIHWAKTPANVDRGLMEWFPRGSIWKGIGYLIVLGAATMALIGATMLWVLNQPMTWARATIAAFIAWMALVFYFGIVPSEWLNYAQTDLVWSNQRTAITIPAFLVLGNEVSISWAAVKDAISGGYHIVMLVVAAVLALEIQRMGDGRPASAEPVEEFSPYGRPLVRGDA